MLEISISKGNIKLGRIPSVSLTPRVSCPPNVPCYKYCYARKAYRMYKNTRSAYDRNYNLVVRMPDEYFKQIQDYLTKKKPEYFRWHVSGDILSQNYLENMKVIAVNNPNTNFLAFTKNFNLDYSYLPDNLIIRFSYWTGWGDYNNKMLSAWYQDGLENRMASDAFECQGSCMDCKTCWDKDTKQVIFNKH